MTVIREKKISIIKAKKKPLPDSALAYLTGLCSYTTVFLCHKSLRWTSSNYVPHFVSKCHRRINLNWRKWDWGEKRRFNSTETVALDISKFFKTAYEVPQLCWCQELSSPTSPPWSTGCSSALMNSTVQDHPTFWGAFGSSFLQGAVVKCAWFIKLETARMTAAEEGSNLH